MGDADASSVFAQADRHDRGAVDTELRLFIGSTQITSEANLREGVER